MTALSARTARVLRASASTLVLGFVSIHPTAALAQDTTATEETKPVSTQTDPNAGANPGTDGAATTDGKTIIVTGQRRALQSAQQIKRNADTVMDSITANDIGAFPDKSVAEALQRVPGITVNRFAATSDTAHFSAEPSGVIIRGLGQVRSEFNGRDTFSANSSRGLSWTDITPELLAGVDTYKNQTADLIEGGIAGSINLRTRLPFDATGQLIQVGARANYGDLSKSWTPDINGFYSNRWQTGMGEIGVMANVAYSHVKTVSEGIQYGRMIIIDNGFGADGPSTAYFPTSVNFLDNEYNRKRTGISSAIQWRSNDRKVLFTGQYNRSVYKNTWQERSFGGFGIGPDLYGQNVFTRVEGPLNGGGPFSGNIPVPAPGTDDFVFDSDGNFQSGTPNRNGALWWGNPGTNVGFGVNDQGEPMFNTCYTWGSVPGCQYQANGVPSYAPEVGTGSRINQNKNMTQDFGANLKWEATDNLRFNFDGQYVNSTVDNYDLSIEMHSFANVFLDATGKYPRIELSDPTNINQSDGFLANPNNWYLRSVMDHLEKSKGHQLSLRSDGEYDFNTNWLDSLKWGVRYADRQQKVKWSTYNWQNVANTWTDYGNCPHPYWNIDSQPGSCPNPGGVTFNGYPDGFYEVSPFGTGFHGGQLGDFPFIPFDFLKDHRADEFSQELTGVGTFIPICQRNGQVGNVPVELEGSCFTPDEIADVREKTTAAFAMLKFGGPDALWGGLPISGNIGLRYVKTSDRSDGFLRFATVPGLDADNCPAAPLVPGGLTGTGTPSPVPGTAPFPAYCYLTPADLDFASGGGTESVAKNKFHHWLPSFNLRVDISPKWLVRFAASKALSRPDMGLLKNFTAISMGLPNGNDLTDPRWVRNASGTPVGVNPVYTASAFNPYLKPTTAWQFDLSVENYFGNVGQFSFAAFYKEFSDYIQYGIFNLDVVNAGTTRTVQVRGPANGKGAKIKGIEVAYQRFFDFLPSPLNGLGIQANATYVKNSGVPNSGLTPVGTAFAGNLGGGQTNAGNANTALTPGSLEGLSKYTFNLVGMYEKGPVSARVAYNWRSKYLVTVVDCCVYLPVWQKAAGYLDASLRYRVTDGVEFSLEGSNLLNTKTVLQQQVADETSEEGRKVLTPNGWFQNDRRFIIGARWKMGK